MKGWVSQDKRFPDNVHTNDDKIIDIFEREICIYTHLECIIAWIDSKDLKLFKEQRHKSKLDIHDVRSLIASRTMIHPFTL